MPRPEQALLQRWVAATAPSPAAVAAGQELLADWAQPHRRYHELRHLTEVLTALDELRDLSGPAAPVPRTVVIAAYWHDAVYDPRAADNEQRSADRAAAVLGGLGLPPGDVREVVRLVLLTAGHLPQPGDTSGELLCDADLAVLAATPARYREYAAGVREEYAHLGEDQFRAGRASVLQDLLGRPALYSAGARHLEPDARRNLTVELAALSERGG